MPMEPYSLLIPDTDDPVIALTLDRKTGKIPKGNYGFIEFYCSDKGCDCRRTTIFVVNEKMQEKAVISMGFDLDEPLAGPFLDDFHPQSAYAGQLLEMFVDTINEHPAFLESLYRHYREVRTAVDGKKYRGKAFPRADRVMRQACPAPDLPESFMDVMKALGADSVSAPAISGKRASIGTKQNISFAALADGYVAAQTHSGGMDRDKLQEKLHRFILNNADCGLQIAELLMHSGDPSDEANTRIDAALWMLFDALEILRTELERKRPGSEEKMHNLQSALAQKIFVEQGDDGLCAAVSHILLQSRVELLPVLHEANGQRMFLEAHAAAGNSMQPADIMHNVCACIEEMGANSPFEAMEHLLQLLALGPINMQTAFYEELLGAAQPLLRDTAALMILHPSAEVRQAVARLLPDHGRMITPETLRRLIISRNWFPEDIRAGIDLAINAARKGRIDCAPLPRSLDAKVYASPVDGACAQSFQVIIPDGKGFISCSILLKRGTGVADAFVVPLATQKKLNEFLEHMYAEAGFIESTMDYLDQRVCHALAEGASLGRVPSYWLLHVAEQLGKDQWRAQPFDARRELALLRERLAARSPELLEAKSRSKALNDSADWAADHAFTSSWFEDDAELDQVITKTLAKNRRKAGAEWAVVETILADILEKRRMIWLERLTLCALWLRSSRKPPVPWHQMFHLAEAVADTRLPLAEIPLMEAVAMHSFGAFMGRNDEL